MPRPFFPIPLSRRRVVVTGLGAVTPLGLSVRETWEGVLAGRSGVALITDFDVSAFSTRFSAQVKGFDVTRYLPSKEARKMDPFIHYGIAAAHEAIEDAGLVVPESGAPRIGVAFGSGIGGLPGIESGHLSYLNGGPRRISPFFVPANIINMIAGHVAILYRLRGPNLAIVTACTSGTHNIGLAARLIAWGDADAMIVGGAEMATSPMGVGGFAAARALSSRNDAPEQASRPWDRSRDGFVLGDGAGAMMIEELEHARRRGARIYAEVAGFGMNADAWHMTSPPEDGSGAAACMHAALADAGLAPEAIGYINAHATSTPQGDIAETRAIKAAFGDHARRVPVSSTKSMTGHLLGAAGAVEAVFSVLAIRDNVVPPTINLDDPDPECDLDYVPHEARQGRVDVAMSNSFGFGGTNGTLIFRRFS